MTDNFDKAQTAQNTSSHRISRLNTAIKLFLDKNKEQHTKAKELQVYQ